MSIRYFRLPLCALLLVSLSLGGCTGLRRALGIEKVVPDEFAVVAQPPLSMPPEYGLRPPKPGAAPTQELSSTQQARQSIFRASDKQGDLPPGADQRSPGENQLLRQAGAGSAPSDIRDVVNREATQLAPIDSGFVDKLLFWRESEKPVGITDSVINPEQEAQHLHDGKAPGAPAPTAVTSDMTGPPIIERKRDPTIVGTF